MFLSQMQDMLPQALSANGSTASFESCAAIG